MNGPPTRGERPSTARGRPFVLAAAVAVALAIPSGHVDTVDAGTRLLEARALLFQGTTRIPAAWVDPRLGLAPAPLREHPDGSYRSPYGIGLQLVWLPFVAAGWVFHRLTSLSLETAAGAAVSYVNLLLVSGILLVLSRLQRAMGFAANERLLTLAALLVGTTRSTSRTPAGASRSPRCASSAVSGRSLFTTTRVTRHWVERFSPMHLS